MQTYSSAYSSAEALPSQLPDLKGGEALRDRQNKAVVSAANATGFCGPCSVPVTWEWS